MQLQKIDRAFSVCKLERAEDASLEEEFTFFARTDAEISLVCPTEFVPARTLAREDGWRAFRIVGVLDFSLIGILAKLSAVLAEKGIGIFAVSTYNTDYILVKEENYAPALAALAAAGWEIV